MNELKEAAHLMAQEIAKPGVQILPLLIKFITIRKNPNKKVRKTDEFKKLSNENKIDINLVNKVLKKYKDRVKKALAKKPEKERQVIIQNIDELYNTYGSRKTMQDHHWIEQSRINMVEPLTGGYQYPFLQCPPMKENLLTCKSNLSLITGHNGGHKGRYNKLLDENLKDIQDYLIQKLGKKITPEMIAAKPELFDYVNKKVNAVITTMQNAVEADTKVMNNQKLYILD